MTEQQTPVMEKPAVQEAPPAPPAVPRKAPGKKKKKRVLKLVITLVIIAIVIGAVGFLLWRFVFYTPDTRQILDDTVMIGSIQSNVEGSGVTKAKNSASISPDSGGKVLELYINEGDTVTAGQQLYRMDDTKARDAVTAAQKEVDNCNKELQAIYDKIAELTVTAPHAGKLTHLKTLQVGANVPEGYYPVPVEVGLADNFNVEIKSGLSEGDTVFEAYITDQGNSYSGGGMVFYG